tara:strand:+ start:1055 stop:1645 length:591 start_codon:yes stop_codon:yes gene_type:complete
MAKSSSTPAKATKKVVKKSAPAPTPVVVTPPPAPEPVVAETVENQTVDSVEERFSVFSSKLSEAIAALNAVKTEYKVLEKICGKELKAARKLSAKKKRAGNRAPSGFIKPTLISPELATFLGKPSGTEMARTEVTREINKYIKANKLQDPENGRKINPDAPLAKLLKIKKDDTLTYFNLQRYMSPHFPSSAASSSA